MVQITGVDSQLDALTPNPGQQRYEKMISGMYLGELARLSLLHLTDKGVLVWGDDNVLPEGSALKTPWAFKTKYLSRIGVDNSDGLKDVENALETTCGVSTNLQGRKIVQEVCELVTKRAARLAAVGIAGCVAKMQKDGPVMAGVDGYACAA